MGYRLRLLIVEDSEDDALLEVRELCRGGFDPVFTRVEKLQELEAALDSGPWDALIVDYNLPGFNGLDALRIVKAKGLDIPTILVSGTVGEERAVDAMKAGAHDYIMKQNMARLVPAMERELREADGRLRRQQMAELLRESEEKYRTLYEESKDAIYIMGPDGVMTDINPAGCELFGYTKEELFSIDIARELYCDPVGRELFLLALHEKGYVRDLEIQMKKKGGECICVLKSAVLIRDDEGVTTGYQAIIHDITQRKQLERQLIHAQKMESVGLLAGGVAHDFNNLLTGINGYGQLIQEQFAADNELLASCIDQVMGATGRAIELTRRLLAFSRKQIINLYPVSVNDIVINLNKLLNKIISEDIEFGTRLVNKRLTVMADQGQIDQALINLATNARDAMPQGGRFQIRTDRIELDEAAAQRLGVDKGGAYALIAVSDTGHGMDRETLEKIFEPFFTTKETGKGTGLGLPIIYGIVKQHGGAITVESEPAKGTTFTIYLPLVEAEIGGTQLKEPASLAYGTETILLAEDDWTVRGYMQKILEMAGYTVITARNGEEAVEKFRENGDSIALVLCDVVMPKKNGKEVYDEIRAMAPQTRVLFLSGYNDEIIHTKGILHENIELIVKPVDRQKLLAKLREMLEA